MRTCLVISCGLLVVGCSAPTPPPAAGTPPQDSVAATGPTETVAAGLTAQPMTPEPEPPFEWEPDFQRLSLADFLPYPADADSWTERDDVLVCTGKPRGYLATRETFQNFTWRLEYRFVRPGDLKDDAKFKGNTGFLIYITGEAKIWPVSLEVQGKHLQMAAIKENGGAEPPVVQDDDAARKSARKPVGQWNALEIRSRDGALSVTLNGVPVSSSEPNFLSSGNLGIQAEDHPFEVRRLRIRRDESQ
ncbi:MAG: DUF1080 domain-containing protein [Planctomycetaceae bacterium]|nr:DUF1080 domain-containing protein [Planctomycetaceae bacterium]